MTGAAVPEHARAVRKRRLVIGLALVAVTLPVLWWTGLLNRAGLGPTPTLLRAARGVERLPRQARIEGTGLVARIASDARCDRQLGFTCRDDRFHLTWSVCPVAEPTARWARTSRTDTCDPKDSEEGIVPGGWDQEAVGRAEIAGFDGFIVRWWPNTSHANRGTGCSFRGYRRSEAGGWLLLHMEATPECNDELLAMMLSTRVERGSPTPSSSDVARSAP